MSSPSPEPGSHVVDRRPPPPPSAPPAVAPYHPPPPYAPPDVARSAPTDGRAITSLAASIFGILLGVPFGLPGLALGPLGYFMGRSAIGRIDAEPGTVGGRGMATVGWVLGVVATAIGAVVSLVWLILLLVVISTPPAFE